MKICVSKSVKRMAGLLVSVSFVGGLTACTTTSTTKITEAAPVTYKIGGGNSSYAAVRMPERAPAPATSLPQTAPSQSPLAVPRPAPQAVAPAPAYDLSSIDRGLYDHMKVGKPYKVAGKSYSPAHNPDYDKIGTASWYGDKFHGKPTANGEVYDKNALTAAHTTLPLNSYVIVTNLDNGKSIKVRLNDRGPFIDNRIIDLSEAAAKALSIQGKGLGRVRVQYAGAAPAGGGVRYTPSQPAQVAERAPEPAPVPTPVPQVVPMPSLPTPVPQPQDYTPLRNGGQPEAERVAAVPQTQPDVFEVPNIMDGSSNSGLSIALPERQAQTTPRVPIPEPAQETNEDDVITLTIKGPVHMAKTTTSNNQGQPEFIPAVHEEEK